MFDPLTPWEMQEMNSAYSCAQWASMEVGSAENTLNSATLGQWSGPAADSALLDLADCRDALVDLRNKTAVLALCGVEVSVP